MHWRKKRLLSCYLYVIVGANLAKAAEMAGSGVDVLQLRDKTLCDKRLLRVAGKIALFCKANKVLFIVNDRLDIAIASKADGVHLGQDDLPVREARKIVPENFLIGISTHSVRQAVKAQDEGADYIGFGPVFATKTKPLLKPLGLGRICSLNEKIKIPYFAIGNVNLGNLKLLKSRGVRRIALHSALYNSRSPKEKVKSFRKQLFQ